MQEFFRYSQCQYHRNQMERLYIIIIIQHHNHCFILVFHLIQFIVHLDRVQFGIITFRQRIIIQYVFIDIEYLIDI
jgi:hypothetical protein